MNRGITVNFVDSDESLLLLRGLAKTLDENDKVCIPLLDFVGIGEDEGVSNVTYNKSQFVEQLDKIRQLLFLELFIFSNDAAVDSIKDYENFINSSCKTVVLCSDSVNFDIYIKDPKVLSALYDQCRNRLHSKLEIITDKNDGRYTFNVL